MLFYSLKFYLIFYSEVFKNFLERSLFHVYFLNFLFSVEFLCVCFFYKQICVKVWFVVSLNFTKWLTFKPLKRLKNIITLSAFDRVLYRMTRLSCTLAFLFINLFWRWGGVHHKWYQDEMSCLILLAEVGCRSFAPLLSITI